MGTPIHPKAYSEHIGPDPRLKEVKIFQQANSQVTQHLNEIAARSNTSFNKCY